MGAGKSSTSKGKERERPYGLPVTPPLPLSPSPTYTYKSYRSEPSSPVIRSRPSIISTPPSPLLKPARKLPIVPNPVQSPKSSTTPHSSLALASASTTTTTTTTYSFDRTGTRDSGVTNATSPGSATVQASDEHSHPSQELWMLEENQRYSKDWSVHPFGGGSPVSAGDEGDIPLDQLIPTFSSSIHGSSESSDDDSDDDRIEYAYYPYRKMRYDPLPTTAGSTPPLNMSSDEEAVVDVYVDDSYSPIEDVGEMAFASSSSSIDKPKSEDKRRSLSPIQYAKRSSQVYSDGLAIEDLDDELEEMSFARNEHLSPSTDSPLRPSPRDEVPFGVMGQRNRSGTGSTITAGISSPSEKRNSTLSSGSLRRAASLDTLASVVEINRKSSLTVSTTNSPTDLRPNRYIDPVEHVHPQLALLPHPNTFSLATTHVQGGSAVGRVGKSARGDQAGFIPLPTAMYPTPNSAPVAGGGGGGGPKDKDKDKDKDSEKKRRQRGLSLPRTPSLSLSSSLSNSHSRSKSKSKKLNSPNLALSASLMGLGIGGSLASPQTGREKQPYEMWIEKGL